MFYIQIIYSESKSAGLCFDVELFLQVSLNTAKIFYRTPLEMLQWLNNTISS